MAALLSQGPIFLFSLIFMLSIVVIIHELGHYWAGRYFGAAVESFSVGFGKPIFERKDKRGTRWRVNWIPLGGFVKFVGESQLPGDVGKEEQGPIGKPYGDIGVGARSIVSIAGPLANFILAIGIFAVIFGFNGTYESKVQVVSVAEGQPAAQAGLEPGDIFVEIDGREILRAGDLQEAVLMTAGRTLEIVVERNSQIETFQLVPENKVRDNGLGQMVSQATLGVKIQEVADATTRIKLNPIQAVGKGVEQTGFILDTTVTMIGRLVTGKESINALSGPVAIGDTGRRIFNATMGETRIPLSDRIMSFVWYMLSLCAAVSIGIGFFNLLPLPILDGGHLVFNAYEAVFGKAMPEKVQEMALMAGLCLLLTMFVFITWGDILETGLFNGSTG